MAPSAFQGFPAADRNFGSGIREGQKTFFVCNHSLVNLLSTEARHLKRRFALRFSIGAVAGLLAALCWLWAASPIGHVSSGGAPAAGIFRMAGAVIAVVATLGAHHFAATGAILFRNYKRLDRRLPRARANRQQ
jgi:hypothetical protein